MSADQHRTEMEAIKHHYKARSGTRSGASTRAPTGIDVHGPEKGLQKDAGGVQKKYSGDAAEARSRRQKSRVQRCVRPWAEEREEDEAGQSRRGQRTQEGRGPGSTVSLKHKKIIKYPIFVIIDSNFCL